MPGSRTAQGRQSARTNADHRVAFRWVNGVGTPDYLFAAQWLAYACPGRRFVAAVADGLTHGSGADVGRYSFIAVDSHHLLLAGLPAHCPRNSMVVTLGSLPGAAVGPHEAQLPGSVTLLVPPAPCR